MQIKLASILAGHVQLLRVWPRELALAQIAQRAYGSGANPGRLRCRGGGGCGLGRGGGGGGGGGRGGCGGGAPGGGGVCRLFSVKVLDAWNV